MKAHFRFEKLDVWQEARALNRRVYEVTRKLPDHEAFGIIAQLRRAGVSVASNIAEGAGRNSDKDFAHFLEQAYGSLMEVSSLLYLALDEQYLSEKEVESLLNGTETLARRMATLNRTLAVKTSKTPFTRVAAGKALDSRPTSPERSEVPIRRETLDSGPSTLDSRLPL